MPFHLGLLFGHGIGVLFMLETASRPLVSDPRALQALCQILGIQSHAELRGHPVRDLLGRPGLRRAAQLLPDRLFHLGGQRRLLARMGLIGQGVEAALQERLDPVAHPFLTEAQMDRDPGNAPAGCREPDHLQPVARAGLHARFVRAAVQFLLLSVVQTHAIHRVLPPTLLSGNLFARPA